MVEINYINNTIQLRRKNMTFPQSYPQPQDSLNTSDDRHLRTPSVVSGPFVKVAVPVPLRKMFDYETGSYQPAIGARVRVPFGRRSVVGVVIEGTDEMADGIKAKPIEAVIDDDAIISPTLMRLLIWAAGYYHYPIGEVIAAALPPILRRGDPARPQALPRWSLTESGRLDDIATLKRSPLGQKLVQCMREADDELFAADDLGRIGKGWRGAVNRLVDGGWVQPREDVVDGPRARVAEQGPTLEPDQQAVVAALTERLDGFNVSLLHGVTGSGKTEVYIRLLQTVIDSGGQALVLVPEISLTPQLVDRLQRRLGVAIAVLHSGISGGERHRMWWSAVCGDASVVLGTRSAVFAPLPHNRLVIVDEEHDASFKQQDGFRYHGRDVAIMRAQLDGAAVVLGSATPSLESMENVHRQRYARFQLPRRTGGASLPSVHIIDLNTHTPEAGLSPPLLSALEARLAAGEQSLLFINRRGFAPVVMCIGCGWFANCERCDARLTFHQGIGRWRCHHCGAEHRPLTACPECSATELVDVGEGTEQIEARVAERFPQARLLRLDRDITTSAERLSNSLRRIAQREVDIVVGTQMVTKGHDFPDLTLVGVVNPDQALFSVDYRTPEQLVQQLTQVSGRAGRGQRAGDVLVQTRYPKDPVFDLIARHDFDSFIERERDERRGAGFPPYAHFALLRADAPQRHRALGFLIGARQLAVQVLAKMPEVEIMDPVPSPMERRAGRYRAQLLVRSSERAPLHNFLDWWIDGLERDVAGRRLRWSVDVDPIDLY